MPNSSQQQQQLIQAVAQELQKGTDPKMILQQLVKMGLPQDQAVKIIQYVAQQLQGQQQAAPEETGENQSQMAKGGTRKKKLKSRSSGASSILQDPQVQQLIQMFAQMQGVDPAQIMQQLQQLPPDQLQQAIQQMVQVVQQAAQQQQQAPQQQMAPQQGQAPQQAPMEGQMKMGGTKKGSTYSGGVWFENGGSYIPEYTYAYGGYHSEIPRLFDRQPDANPKFLKGGPNEPCPDVHMIKNDQGYCVCGPGYEADEMTGQCYPIVDNPNNNVSQNNPYNNGYNRQPINQKPVGFGFEIGNQDGKDNYNIGANIGSMLQDGKIGTPYYDVRATFPRIFGKNNSLDLTGNLRENVLNVGAGTTFPFLNGRLGITGGYNYDFNKEDFNADDDYMRTPQKKSDINVGVDWNGKLGNTNVRLNGYYGTPSRGGYKTGGQYNAGDVLDVTPQQLEMLRKQGYQFDII